MVETKDWMPSNHEALHDKATLTMNVLSVSANRERMGLGSGTPLGGWLDSDFLPEFTHFDDAYGPWVNPGTRTKIITLQLNEAEATFKPMYRKLASLLKSSPLVTDDDLLAMGLPQRSGGGGGHNPPPTTYVSTTVELPGPGRVIIHFRDADSDHKAKPHGVHGAEIRWGLLDARPTDVSELPNSSFDTHTPFTLDFEGHDRHKTLYFALRWENTVGEKGPWNDIQVAVVP
jgi:hypothetical protein